MQERYTATIPKLYQNKRTTGRAVNILLMGIFALILLRDVGNVSLDRFIFIGLTTFACLLTNKTGIYCILAFLTPLATGISCTYIAAIALVILLFKDDFRLHVQHLGFVCMAGILFLELLSAFRGMFGFEDFLRFTGIFVLSFLRIFDLRDDYDNEAILDGYIFGFWAAMASILGQMLEVYSLQEFLSMGARFGDTRVLLDASTEGMLVSYNPNGLGYLCVLAALFCLLLYNKNKKKWYILSFYGASLLGIMTQSRAFVLAYTLGIVLYVLLSCRSLKSMIKSVLVLTIGGGIIIGLALWLMPNYVDSMLIRFQDADISNGRIDITTYYFNEMFEQTDRLIFGVGLQNYPLKYGFLMSAHNATQEVVIAWGIIGLLLVAALFIGVFYNGRMHNSKARRVQYLPLVIYLVAIQSGQGFSDTSGMLRIMVAYSAILLPLNGGNRNSTE